ncbi:hypothetical protein [Croceitalea rosinachiae]|uniref:Uncharacterized protein n=1 Tax=Croceitalea rosinachiae TaxID=3075596 RepID=A0ABU3A9L3_9FLAO|nr:hypothetical protein [Croceitalea sp. F388]MDT0606881.1 hypothetical protein [Croceitalea sp. F388]
MKYRKYIVIAFIGALFLPLLSAKAEKTTEENFNIKSVVFVEQEQEESFDFDTAEYLPEGFDPYQDNVSVNSLNYIEDDSIDLGFDTADYLPENFNPYTK